MDERDDKTPRIDVWDESTWRHLIIPVDELSERQQNEMFCHHAATGGDLVYLQNGMVLAV